jgi:hypothetical protein
MLYAPGPASTTARTSASRGCASKDVRTHVAPAACHADGSPPGGISTTIRGHCTDQGGYVRLRTPSPRAPPTDRPRPAPADGRAGGPRERSRPIRCARPAAPARREGGAPSAHRTAPRKCRALPPHVDFIGQPPRPPGAPATDAGRLARQSYSKGARRRPSAATSRSARSTSRVRSFHAGRQARREPSRRSPGPDAGSPDDTRPLPRPVHPPRRGVRPG